MTDTELKLIAAPAMIGLRSNESVNRTTKGLRL